MPKGKAAGIAAAALAGRANRPDLGVILRSVRRGNGELPRVSFLVKQVLEVGIGGSFFVESCDLAMAGEQLGVSGELHDAAKGCQHLGVIGVGQIGSPDGSADDEVSADQDLGCFAVVDDMSDGMSWGMDDPELEVADGEDLVIFEAEVGGTRGYDEWEGEDHAIGVLELGLIEAVNCDGCLREAVGDHLVIGDMIEVAMGEPEADEVPALFLCMVKQGCGGVVGCVEQDGVFGLFVSDEEGIGCGDAARVDQYFHSIILEGVFYCSSWLRIVSRMRMLPMVSCSVTKGLAPSWATAAKASASRP